MKKTLFVLLTVLVVMMTGCGTNNIKPPIIEPKTYVVSFPEALLTACVATQPPKQSVYIGSDSLGREKLLTDYTIALLKDLKNCSDQIAELRSLQEKQKQIYSQPAEVKK